ncbi:LOW QUALITY PROTEIN: zinc finger C3H1 domain-containing protein [Rhinatrema bivittatum]|uniref:LOW QUALITY PROTEIN: zinc finger C3H1 domain-containing protein n=1 Tax=Rhinatrema bivittatum TaxID=194408 RepID=UPI00112A1A66|nr:LOW QUALITY PROTEIN: zinc finger C3H1 domain-containing protein [Rhinatrema bivittatum]
MAELDSRGLSPKEEGELEDGEISDDDNPEPAPPPPPVPALRRPSSGSYAARLPPRRPPGYGHGYRSSKESFRSPPPEASPRPSFWERSHTALDRFRYRGRGMRGYWTRGDRDGRSGRPRGCGWREPSPRKFKNFGRSPAGKQSYSKNESCEEESFEDLLLKYKQIKLELESLNKDEKLALTNKNLPQNETAVVKSKIQTAVESSSIAKAPVKERSPEVKNQVKKFQAFELKPLRQKLSIPSNSNKLKQSKDGTKLLALNVDLAEPVQEKEGKEPTSHCESNTSDLASDKKPAEDEEELSELRLRLLALQSASKNWYQKEQQVMKESKEKLITTKVLQQKAKPVKQHSSKKVISPSCAAKQALRKQKTKAWKKLQQQKEEEERRQKQEEEQKKQAEEEERRKREEEIRKIRDLSSQEEQYNRFMKLVGGKRKLRSKSSDIDLRWSLDKLAVEGAGGIYQYDNYDEVAMDTDSETNSPAASPVQPPSHQESPLRCFPVLPQIPVSIPPPLSSERERSVDGLSSVSREPPPPPPPLPPEEPEQPPKPPFADEEEEEEMLLREELLKSLANKRSKPEENSSNSCPPSPSVLNNSQPVPRINLSAVNINTISMPRVQNKMKRVPRPARQVIALPKHKSVVVTLNASDDSESDGEPSNSNMSVFGGLEFMIKEARRSVEQASKPKVPPKSEKENDPMRTPEALPEDKKIEYRLLKEEIASREKEHSVKNDQNKIGPSPVNSDIENESACRIALAATHVSEAEAKHRKHSVLLMKDESMLKHLLQQEAKKKEAVRIAEAKIAKLSEQMQATEKILSANKIFLKKLQEQIHKVQQRVLVKKSLALKYGEELARAKAVASQEIGKRKREQDNFGPNKMFKLEKIPSASPKKQSAELIALEKKRLQQLESEYALKIKKLKEAHALKSKEQPSIVPTLEEEPEYVLPQPSRHDLTQDKLTLDAEENDMEEEVLSASSRARRRSFRESNSTKPNLKQPEMTPNKEGVGKPAKKAVEEPELFLGLNLEELRRLHSEAGGLEELFSESTALPMMPKDKWWCGQEISMDMDFVTAQVNQTEIRPFPFGAYHSPLLVFKSYRFSPYFRTKEKLYLSSVSYSNMIEPKKCFCRFDLTGTCNDDDCQWQHMRDCTLSRKQLFQDILSYNLSLIGCSEKNTDEEISIAAEKYVEKLFGINRDRMSMDQMSVLLVSNINESKGHTPPYTTCKDKRNWKPKYWRKPASESSSDEDTTSVQTRYACFQERTKSMPPLDAVVTSDDIRYFTNETDDISNLEASVLENPQHVQLWIKLAYKYLNQSEGSSSECLDSSLNVLARALEHNRDNPEIWCHYLKLFSKRGTKEEVQEMCETAVEYAPSYQTWWTYLSLENTFDGKDYVCGRMLQFLMEAADGGKDSDYISFQLLEVLLFRVQMNLFTGRQQNAIALLQNALKSTSEKVVAEHLTASDRCLLWLAYVYLIEFNALPVNFYDPANANPARIVSKEPFLIPWQTQQCVKTNPDVLLALLEDAIHACAGDSLPAEERVQLCLPLYRNMICLQKLLDRHDAAVKLCTTLLETCPSSCPLLEALAELYVEMEQTETAYIVWLTAFKENTQNAEVFYSICKFLISQKRLDNITPLMHEFVTSFFECLAEDHTPTDLLRYLLNFPMPLDFKAPLYNVDFTEELLNQQTPYLWLIYCLWQSLHASSGEAVDAFEAALGAVMQPETIQNIWMDYLLFTNNKVIRSKNKVQEIKQFTDLVRRCLVTVPTRYSLPFTTADYWTNYEFHNRVILFYLSCVPKSQHSKLLERFCSIMPTNPGLALRLLQQEWEEKNEQILKLQAKMFIYSIPTCMAIWKIAIAVECLLKGQREVRHLYQRALQKLPLCAALWKDQLLFEASGGGKTDNLRELVSKCQEVGVSLDEPLNLTICRAESKNH